MICAHGTTPKRARELAQTQADLTGYTFLVALLCGFWHVVPKHTVGFHLDNAIEVKPSDGTERVLLSTPVLVTGK